MVDNGIKNRDAKACRWRCGTQVGKIPHLQVLSEHQGVAGSGDLISGLKKRRKVGTEIKV